MGERQQREEERLQCRKSCSSFGYIWQFYLIVSFYCQLKQFVGELPYMQTKCTSLLCQELKS